MKIYPKVYIHCQMRNDISITALLQLLSKKKKKLL